MNHKNLLVALCPTITRLSQIKAEAFAVFEADSVYKPTARANPCSIPIEPRAPNCLKN
jgi:hypothetical protein